MNKAALLAQLQQKRKALQGEVADAGRESDRLLRLYAGIGDEQQGTSAAPHHQAAVAATATSHTTTSSTQHTAISSTMVLSSTYHQEHHQHQQHAVATSRAGTHSNHSMRSHSSSVYSQPEQLPEQLPPPQVFTHKTVTPTGRSPSLQSSNAMDVHSAMQYQHMSEEEGRAAVAVDFGRYEQSVSGSMVAMEGTEPSRSRRSSIGSTAFVPPPLPPSTNNVQRLPTSTTAAAEDRGRSGSASKDTARGGNGGAPLLISPAMSPPAKGNKNDDGDERVTSHTEVAAASQKVEHESIPSSVSDRGGAVESPKLDHDSKIQRRRTPSPLQAETVMSIGTASSISTSPLVRSPNVHPVAAMPAATRQRAATVTPRTSEDRPPQQHNIASTPSAISTANTSVEGCELPKVLRQQSTIRRTAREVSNGSFSPNKDYGMLHRAATATFDTFGGESNTSFASNVSFSHRDRLLEKYMNDSARQDEAAARRGSSAKKQLNLSVEMGVQTDVKTAEEEEEEAKELLRRRLAADMESNYTRTRSFGTGSEFNINEGVQRAAGGGGVASSRSSLMAPTDEDDVEVTSEGDNPLRPPTFHPEDDHPANEPPNARGSSLVSPCEDEDDENNATVASTLPTTGAIEEVIGVSALTDELDAAANHNAQVPRKPTKEPSSSVPSTRSQSTAATSSDGATTVEDPRSSSGLPRPIPQEERLAEQPRRHSIPAPISDDEEAVRQAEAHRLAQQRKEELTANQSPTREGSSQHQYPRFHDRSGSDGRSASNASMSTSTFLLDPSMQSRKGKHGFADEYLQHRGHVLPKGVQEEALKQRLYTLDELHDRSRKERSSSTQRSTSLGTVQSIYASPMPQRRGISPQKAPRSAFATGDQTGYIDLGHTSVALQHQRLEEERHTTSSATAVTEVGVENDEGSVVDEHQRNPDSPAPHDGAMAGHEAFQPPTMGRSPEPHSMMSTSSPPHLNGTSTFHRQEAQFRHSGISEDVNGESARRNALRERVRASKAASQEHRPSTARSSSNVPPQRQLVSSSKLRSTSTNTANTSRNKSMVSTGSCPHHHALQHTDCPRCERRRIMEKEPPRMNTFNIREYAHENPPAVIVSAMKDAGRRASPTKADRVSLNNNNHRAPFISRVSPNSPPRTREEATKAHSPERPGHAHAHNSTTTRPRPTAEVQRNRAAAALKAIRAERYQATHKGEIARQKILKERDERLQRQIREREEYAQRRAAIAANEASQLAAKEKHTPRLRQPKLGVDQTPSPVPRAVENNDRSFEGNDAGDVFLSPSPAAADGKTPTVSINLQYPNEEQPHEREHHALTATTAITPTTIVDNCATHSPRDDEIVFNANEMPSPELTGGGPGDMDVGSPVFRISLA